MARNNQSYMAYSTLLYYTQARRYEAEAHVSKFDSSETALETSIPHRI